MNTDTSTSPALRRRVRRALCSLFGLIALCTSAFAAPGKPLDLIAVDYNGSGGADVGVALDWNAPVGGDPVEVYRVYRKTPTDTAWQIQYPYTTDTSWNQSGLSSDTSYEYCVVAARQTSPGVWQQGPASDTFAFARKRFGFVLPWDDTIASGTTDFSGWNGTIGRIYRNADGTFRVGSANGTPIRFMGVNMSAAACFPDAADAAKVARRMAQFGINMVRIHQIDQKAPKGVFSDNALTTLDPAQMTKLAGFIAALKSNGIYVNLNLHVARHYSSADVVPATKDARLKGIDIFSTAAASGDLRTQQKTYASNLLNYVNGSGLAAYKTDPVVAMIEINNEDGLLFEWAEGRLEDLATVFPTYYAELRAQWTTWLTTKYGTDSGLATAWAAQAALPYGTQVLGAPAPSAPASVPAVAYTGWSLQVNSTGGAAGTAQWINGTDTGVNSPAEDTISDGIQKPTLKVHVTGQNTASKWHVQVLYSGLQNSSSQANYLDPAATHTLRFYGKVGATDAGRDIRVALRDVGGTVNHSIASLHLTPEWQEFTVVFPATGSYTANRAFSLTDLAAQTGHAYFSGFSLTTGNSLTGKLPTFAEYSGLSATNMLTGSASAFNFSAFPQGWALLDRTPSPGAPAPALVADGYSSGVGSLKFTIAPGSPAATGDFQLYRTIGSASLEYGETYQVQFDVKAGASAAGKPFTAVSQLDSPPYTVFGSATFQAPTTWQRKTVSITVTDPSTVSRRVTFGLGAITGEIEFANIYIRKGGAVGVPTGETLAGGIAPITKNEFYSRRRQVQTDWLRFLWDREVEYWTDMRDHVKTLVGAQALLIGTQGEMSPNLLQESVGFDVIDAHGYWQHPTSFKDPWYAKNLPMAGSASLSDITLTYRSGRRIIGKPYLCSEYNHPAPNTYGTEAFPLIGAYAALQGWSGVLAFDYEDYRPEGGAIAWAAGYEGWLSMGRAPAKMVTMPAARAMLDRGHIGSSYNGTIARAAFVTLRDSTAIERIRQTLNVPINLFDFGVDPALALVMPVGMKRAPDTAPADARAVPVAAAAAPYVPAGGHLAWDSGAKRVEMKALRTKAVVGALPATGAVSLDHGVTVESIHAKLNDAVPAGPDNWACFVLTRKDADTTAAFGAVGTRWLLTTTGYTDNHFTKWKTNQGPFTSKTSVVNFGKTPSLVETITGTLTFHVPSGTLNAFALNEDGDAFGSALAVSYAGSGSSRIATVTLPANPLTIWYEMYVTP